MQRAPFVQHQRLQLSLDLLRLPLFTSVVANCPLRLTSPMKAWKLTILRLARGRFCRQGGHIATLLQLLALLEGSMSLAADARPREQFGASVPNPGSGNLPHPWRQPARSARQLHALGNCMLLAGSAGMAMC